jgi:hypothetical protein
LVLSLHDPVLSDPHTVQLHQLIKAAAEAKAAVQAHAAAEATGAIASKIEANKRQQKDAASVRKTLPTLSLSATALSLYVFHSHFELLLRPDALALTSACRYASFFVLVFLAARLFQKRRGSAIGWGVLQGIRLLPEHQV